MVSRHSDSGYSIFDSGIYRNHAAEWLFPQEKATLHEFSMAACESKMLEVNSIPRRCGGKMKPNAYPQKSQTALRGHGKLGRTGIGQVT
jgi:hypothetical protein